MDLAVVLAILELW